MIRSRGLCKLKGVVGCLKDIMAATEATLYVWGALRSSAGLTNAARNLFSAAQSLGEPVLSSPAFRAVCQQVHDRSSVSVHNRPPVFAPELSDEFFSWGRFLNRFAERARGHQYPSDEVQERLLQMLEEIMDSDAVLMRPADDEDLSDEDSSDGDLMEPQGAAEDLPSLLSVAVPWNKSIVSP
jgi:hypothetical protein